MAPRASIIPGLAAALAVAVTARLLHGALPDRAGKAIGEVVLAVLLGLVLANTLRLPARLGAGIRFSFETVLRTAIVLLGASFSYPQVLLIGGKAVGMIVVLMVLALAVAHGLGALAGLPRRLPTLIGVGTAVCGNSAISAVAPVIGAADEEVSFAIAVNTLLGTIAVFVYPALAHALSLSDEFFGTWVGMAVNDTSQVLATGFAVSEKAGELATAVKLTRNALLGFVVVGLGLAYAGTQARSGSLARRLRESIPLFVIGFLVLAAFNTAGTFDALSRWLGRDVGRDLKEASRFLILVALAGVGMGTKLSALRRTGLRPVWIGVATAVATSLASYAMIRVFGAASG